MKTLFLQSTAVILALCATTTFAAVAPGGGHFGISGQIPNKHIMGSNAPTAALPYVYNNSGCDFHGNVQVINYDSFGNATGILPLGDLPNGWTLSLDFSVPNTVAAGVKINNTYTPAISPGGSFTLDSSWCSAPKMKKA
jgi:hypothetical protein